MKVVYILSLIVLVLVTIPFALLSRVYETLYSLCLFLSSKVDS